MSKKVIILDFDGTFYSGSEVFSKMSEYLEDNRRLFLKSISDEEYDVIVKENKEWNTLDSCSSIANYVYVLKKKYPNYNITIKDFLNQQSSTYDPLVLDNAEFVNPSYIKELCENYPVYVVSNSSHTHLKHYMKVMGVNPKWFVRLVSNKFTSKDKTKKHYYKKIADKENCEYSKVYIFGDGDTSDLEPGRRLGMNTYLIVNASELEGIINKALKEN